jgi:hypothetical protein
VVAVAASFALGAMLLPACGSAGSGVLIHGPEADIELGPVPSTWRRVDVSDALVAYRDDSRRATIAVNARCGKDADDVPLEALRQHLFIYFTDRQIQDQQTLPIDGREALKTVLLARLDGVQKAFISYVLKKNGCVYDFLYICEPATLESATPAFDAFVRGFRAIDR